MTKQHHGLTLGAVNLPIRLAAVFFLGGLLLHSPVFWREPGWEPVGDGVLATLSWFVLGAAAGWVAGRKGLAGIWWGLILAGLPWLGALLDLLLLPLHPTTSAALFATGRLAAGAFAFADAAALLLMTCRRPTDRPPIWRTSLVWAGVGVVWRLPLAALMVLPPSAWPLLLAVRLVGLSLAGASLGTGIHAGRNPPPGAGTMRAS